jgi:hypothetical protein
MVFEKRECENHRGPLRLARGAKVADVRSGAKLAMRRTTRLESMMLWRLTFPDFQSPPPSWRNLDTQEDI